MTAEEGIKQLEEQLSQALEQIDILQEPLAGAHQRIEEVEQQKTAPPAFVKANVKQAPAGQKKPRKKRDPTYNRGRRREAPTHMVEHSISTCGQGGSRLGRVSVARRRHVSEIPPPPAVEVTDHVGYHGWGSPAVPAALIGWREDGSTGYIWSASTPSVRSCEYHHSRGSEVVTQLLGETFEGVPGSDFFASYTIHQGRHQRCWVHVVRDGHDLTAHYAEDGTLRQWFTALTALYERARADAGPDAALPPAKQEAARRQHQHAFEQELMRLCAPYVRTSVPLHTLCERLEHFLRELFVFVARPEVPSDNHLAERSVRPLVIARKISGGSRSPTGSHTRRALFRCFGTWAAQGLYPFWQCLAWLSQQTP